MTGASHKAAIIGGGYAGMAAAVELAAAGIAVTVFEAAKELGGRARRVTLNGMALDNGQHILIGAYRETLELIARVHADPERALIRRPLELFLAGEFPAVQFHLRAAPLPPPFDLAAGLAFARGISLVERWSAAVFLLRMRRLNFNLPRDCTVSELLGKARQSTRCIRLLWEPLCVSALNTGISEASAQVFLEVVKDSMLGRSSGKMRDSDFLIPRDDLTSLFPAPAAAFVEARGGRISSATTIRSVARHAHGYALEGDPDAGAYAHVIVAVAPHRLAPLLAGLPELAALAQSVEQLDYQPIVTCYLQYPEHVRLAG